MDASHRRAPEFCSCRPAVAPRSWPLPRRCRWHRSRQRRFSAPAWQAGQHPILPDAPASRASAIPFRRPVVRAGMGSSGFHGPRASARPVSRKTSSNLVGGLCNDPPMRASSCRVAQRLQHQPDVPPWDARVVLKLTFGERMPVCLPLPFQTSPVSGFCSRGHKCDERASAAQVIDSKRESKKTRVSVAVVL